MPHITIQMYPGRSDELKLKAAKEIVKTAAQTFGVGEDHFSVEIHDVPREEWKEKVYNDVVRPDNKAIFVKPGYTL